MRWRVDWIDADGVAQTKQGQYNADALDVVHSLMGSASFITLTRIDEEEDE